MLPSQHRLTDSSQIKNVFATGRSVSSLPFRLKYTRYRTLNPTKFAFVCTKKELKRSVDRNRVQRRLRAIVRQLLPQIHPGYEVVLLISHHTLTLTPQQLADYTYQAFTQAKLITIDG